MESPTTHADDALLAHPKRLIAMPEVERLVGRRKTAIYAELANPNSTFPRPLKWGRSTRWLAGEVIAYIDALAASRDAAKAGAQ